MNKYFTTLTAEELAALHEHAKISKQRYLANPTLFLLQQTMNDLDNLAKYDNIKLYQITNSIANSLPIYQDTVPSFLQNKNDLKNRITEELFIFDKDQDCSFAMALKLDQYYVYVDFNYSSSGFNCCQSLVVYFTLHLSLLIEHIPANQLPSKMKVDN